MTISEEERVNKIYETYREIIDQHGGVDSLIQRITAKYPMIKDRALLLQLALHEVANIKRMGERNDGVKRLADYTLGERGKSRIIVGFIVKENEYVGCPVCLRRVDDRCERHPDREPVLLKWVVYNGGDESLAINLKFSPRLNMDGKDYVGKTLIVRGTMQEDRDGNAVYVVNRIEREE